MILMKNSKFSMKVTEDIIPRKFWLMISYWKLWTEICNCTYTILDLSKAFDSVHHPTLLNKLRHTGASPEVVKWFESYLTGRSQFVRIGTSVSSSLIDITHGVPQGAILSPLLFSIYVNELPLAPRHSSLKSYVDDSKMFLLFRVKDVNDTKEYLQEDLSRVAKCWSELHLLINPEKTKYLLIGTRQQLQDLPKCLRTDLVQALPP